MEDFPPNSHHNIVKNHVCTNRLFLNFTVILIVKNCYFNLACHKWINHGVGEFIVNLITPFEKLILEYLGDFFNLVTKAEGEELILNP